MKKKNDGNCISIQREEFDAQCGVHVRPIANINSTPQKLLMKIFRETLTPLMVDPNLNLKMIIENGGIVAQLGKALSVEENEDGLSQKLNQALTVGPDAIAAIAVDKSRLNSGVKTTNELLEEKMFEIDKILGISMEGKIEDLRSFIHEMLTEEQSCRKMGIQSRKKSRAQRELDKLASSINYDHPTGDKRYGVKLWGL
eukprot:TRINITY_DN12970_c1_g1_i2.p1 TRINITY_DN12970_c1_g1~~TRINITY_DN12970_c1_g1_i2.p1  ORF type:complete len:199 (+),score=43.31 TRINITY_DN12970_c1_g1_i2:330-926(+)